MFSKYVCQDVTVRNILVLYMHWKFHLTKWRRHWHPCNPKPHDRKFSNQHFLQTHSKPRQQTSKTEHHVQRFISEHTLQQHWQSPVCRTEYFSKIAQNHCNLNVFFWLSRLFTTVHDRPALLCDKQISLNASEFKTFHSSRNFIQSICFSKCAFQHVTAW